MKETDLAPRRTRSPEMTATAPAMLVLLCHFAAQLHAMVGSAAEPGQGPRPPVGKVEGVIVSRQGKPIADSTVVLLPSRFLRMARGKTETDASGRFAFDGVAPGQWIMAWGPMLDQTVYVTVEPGQTATVKLVDRPGGLATVHGRAELPKGGAKGGSVAFVWLDPNRDRVVWPPPLRVAPISDASQYRIDVAPGRYVVLVRTRYGSNEDAPHFPVFSGVVTVGPGEVELDLLLPDSVLTGTVRHSSAKRLAEAQPDLFLSPSAIQAGWIAPNMSVRTMLDANGMFRFEHVAPGRYDLVLRQSRLGDDALRIGTQVLGDVNVGGPKTSVSWTLADGHLVHGRVHMDGNRWASPGMILISRKCAKQRTLIRREPLGPGLERDTRFPIVLVAGDYLALADAGTWNYSQEAAIVTIPDPKAIEARLVPPGTVQVRLRGQVKRIGGRIVRLWQPDGTELPRLHDPMWAHDYHLAVGGAIILPTTRDGVTTIRLLRPGQYVATVDGAKGRTTVEVTAGSISTVTVDAQ